MDISGEYQIPANRETVWRLLNDPEVLRQCIPGCEQLDSVGENQFDAKVGLKIGPVKANFTGSVMLSDFQFPESYKISGEGKGGIAGFASGGATVTLSEANPGTQLNYEVDAKIGGKIAQLGSRLILSTSKKLADQFFDRFAEIAAQEAELVN